MCGDPLKVEELEAQEWRSGSVSVRVCGPSCAEAFDLEMGRPKHWLCQERRLAS